MRILWRYYLREFLKLFAVTGLGLGLTFSLMELINRINDFIPNRPSAGDLLLYALLNLPQFLLYLMPMAALTSGLFVFGQAGRRKETTAVKASGGSIKTLLMPFVFSGLILSVVCFLIGEFLVPDFAVRARTLRDALSKRDNVLAFKEGTVWLKAKDAVVKVDLFLPEKGVIKGISILKMEDSRLSERIEAESAEWKPSWEASGARRSGIWYLKGVTDYKIKTGEIAKYPELQSDLLDSPDIFREDMQKPEEMNVRELFAYTKRLKNAGFRNTKLIVDIHSRISYPLINLIMLVLGISLAVKGGMGSGLITAAIGIFISLLYWVGHTASLSMGYTGILPAFIAAWSMPVLFGGLAAYLFRSIPE